MIKLLMHIFGITYAMITFGGKTLPWNNALLENGSNDQEFYCGSANDCFCLKVKCPSTWSHGFWILFNIGFVLNIVRSIFVMTCMIRPDKEKTQANFEFVFSQGESKLAIVLFILLVPLLWFGSYLSPDWNRDLAGFYVFLAFFDICFIWRNHFPNKKMASMITWTEVVSRSILDFLMVGLH